jgi:hypothetical protein
MCGATRTKTFEGLAFTSQLQYLLRFAQIGKKKVLAARPEEERRLIELEDATIQRNLNKIERAVVADLKVITSNLVVYTKNKQYNTP